ncbi:hypothetical protein ACFLTV_02555, partial [Chloroflexota bacterium]
HHRYIHPRASPWNSALRVIRLTTEDCLAKVKSFLQQRNIQFCKYDYPDVPEGKCGEERGGIVANNLGLFLPVFYANSVAALTMSEKDYCKYLERLLHTAFNPKDYSHEQEGKCLANLAALKLGRNETGLSHEDFTRLVKQFTQSGD